MAKPPNEVVPSCPRCGYDQSGACGTWQTGCPLEGTCPECGLRFEWADAFNPFRKQLPWLFEHKRRWSPGCVRAVRSLLMAIVPSRFWKRVSPAHTVGWVVVLWPLILWMTMAASVGAVRAAYLYSTGYVSPYHVTTTFSGGVFVLTPKSPGLQLQDSLIDGFIVPWFPSPASWGNWKWVKGDIAETWTFPLAAIASSLVTGVVLLNLRASRRICGIKGSHIVRAMVYRLAPLGALYAGWCLTMLLLHLQLVPFGYRAYQLTGLFVSGAGMLWGAWWWHSALLTGWQMRDARLAAALISVIDLLAGVIVVTLILPSSIVFLTF